MRADLILCLPCYGSTALWDDVPKELIGAALSSTGDAHIPGRENHCREGSARVRISHRLYRHHKLAVAGPCGRRGGRWRRGARRRCRDSRAESLIGAAASIAQHDGQHHHDALAQQRRPPALVQTRSGFVARRRSRRRPTMTSASRFERPTRPPGDVTPGRRLGQLPLDWRPEVGLAVRHFPMGDAAKLATELMTRSWFALLVWVAG